MCNAFANRSNDRVVQRFEAAVWLYPNGPGRREVASGKPPFRLSMDRGIAVYPRDAVPPGPRLPLLGLPALLNNGLDLLNVSSYYQQIVKGVIIVGAVCLDRSKDRS